jgi:O-antigen ligase
VRFPVPWWRVLWALLFASGFVFRTRSAADINDAPVDGFALFRIGCVFTIALVLFLRLCLKKTPWPAGLFTGLLGIISLYPLASLVSTAWSVRPPWTAYKSLEFLTDIWLLAVILATLRFAGEYKRLVNWTWMLLGLLVLSAWIGAALDPADALFSDPSTRIMPLHARLVGVVPIVSCNDLSEICAVLALVALCRLLVDPEAAKRKARYRVLFVAAIVTLIFTQTRGSFLAFIVGVVLLLILTRRYRLVAACGVTALLVGTALLSFTNVGTNTKNFLLRGQSVDEVSGFSGRGEVWQASFDKIAEHPLTGYGGFAGARFVVLPVNSLGSSNLNSYVDGALDIGVCGPIILITALLSIGWNLVKSIDGADLSRPDSALALEMLLAFTVLLIRSVESSNLTTQPMLSFLVILGAAEVLRRERRSLLVEPFRQFSVSVPSWWPQSSGRP